MKGADLRRWAGRLGRTVGLFLVFVAALATGAAIHSDLPVARRLIARAVGAAFSDLLEGKVEIEAILHVGPARVVIRKISLLDAYGQRVLALSDVRIDLSVVGLLRGLLLSGDRLTVIVDHVRVERADVEILADPKTGEPTIARAIAPAPRPATPGAEPDAGARVFLPAVEIGLVSARARLRDQPPLEAEIRSVQGQLLGTPRGLAVDVRRFGATLRGFGADARGTGTLNVRAPGPARGTFEGFFGDVELKASAFLHDRHVELSVDVLGADPGAVSRVLPGWPLRERVSGHVEAKGELPLLETRAALRAGSASIDLEGPVVVRPPESATLRIKGRHVDVRIVAAEAPATDLSVDATVRARIEGGVLRADVSAKTEPTVIEGIDVPAVDAEATLHAGGVKGTATLHEPGLPTKAAFIVSKDGAIDVDAKIDGFDLARIERLPRRGLAGRGTAAVRMHLEQGKLKASIDATAVGISAEGVTARRARVVAEIAGPVDALPAVRGTARVDADGLTVRGFSVDHATADLRGSKDAAVFDLDVSGERIPTVHAAGTATFGTKLAVRDTRIHVKKDPVVVEGEIAALDLDRGSVDVRRLHVTGAGGDVTGRLRVAPELLELQASGENVDLDALARAFGLGRGTVGGRMRVAVELTAGRDVTRGRIRLGLGDATLSGVSGLSLQMSADLEGQRVTGEASGLLLGLGTFGASWDAMLAGAAFDGASFRDVTGKAELQVSDVFLPVSRALLPKDSVVRSIDGRAYAKLLLERRTAAAPLPNVFMTAATRGLVVTVEPSPGAEPIRIEQMDLSLTGALDGTTGDSTGTTLVVDPKGELLTANGALRIDPEQFRNDPARALSGLVRIPLDAVITLLPRSIADLPPIVRPEGFSGTIYGSVHVKGSLAEPTLYASAEGSELTPEGGATSRPLRVRADAQYEWNTDAASARATASIARTDVATAALRATIPGGDLSQWVGDARVDLSGLPLDLLSGLAKNDVRGTLFGRATLSRTQGGGTAAADIRISHASVEDVLLGEGAFRVTSSGNAVQGNLELSETRGDLKAEGAFSVDFAGPLPKLQAGAPVSGRVVARNFSAVAFSPLLRGILSRVGGGVDADLTLAVSPPPAGAPPDTEWTGGLRGTAKLRDGTVLIDLLGLEVRDVFFEMKARGQGKTTEIKVDDLRGRVRSNRDNIHGSASFVMAGLRVLRGTASVAADDMPVLFRGAPQGRVTGAALARLKREPDSGMLVDVDVSKLTMRLPQSSAREVVELGDNPDVSILQFTEEPGGFESVMPWRLTVHLGREVRLERRDVSLGVTGTPVLDLGDETRVTGTVELTPGGRVPILTKVFVIERGRVIFDTGEPTNPRVDVTAALRTQGDAVVYIDVTGTLRQPKIALRSDPPMAEPEVFALLLGGTSTDSSSSTDSKSPSGAAAGATALGSSVDVLGLNQLLSDTPVDFRVDTTAESRARYTAAVRVRPNLWFEASTYQQSGAGPTGTGDQSVFSGTVDYRFTRRWSLRTEVGTSGGALDLLWQYRY